MNDLASVLALLEARQAQPKVETIVTRNDPNYVQVRAKAKVEPKAQVVKAKQGAGVFGLILPEKGTLTAEQFIQAIRDAGKRAFKAHNAKGEEIIVRKVDQSKVREDTIIAIAGYIGYDGSGNFGEQDNKARSQASIELKYRKLNGPERNATRTAFKSVQGYVAGVCDHEAKLIANMQGLEVSLVDSIVESEKMAKQARETAKEAAPELAKKFLALAKQADEQVKIDRAKLDIVQKGLKAAGV